MKVLITGSSGSLGGMLINYLIPKGVDIVGIDIRESDIPLPSGHFSFHRCCISDRDKLISVFAEEKPDRVVHLACSFNKVRNRNREYEIDIEGARNVLDATVSTLSVKQLIFSSSALAYGASRENRLWIDETDPLCPGKSRYGINKKMVEECYGCNDLREDLRIVSLRLCTVIGPSFDKPKSVTSLLIRYPWLPAAFRKNCMQFIHSDDLVRIIELMLNDSGIEGIYNVAPDSYSVIEKLVPWKEYRNIPVPLIKSGLVVLWHLKILNFQPAALNNAIYPIVIDPSKLISRYGYRFRYSSDEAFADTMVNNRIPAEARI